VARRIVGRAWFYCHREHPISTEPELFWDYVEWVKTDNIDADLGVVTRAAEGLSAEGASVGRIVPPGAVLVTCIAGSRDRIGDAAVTDRQVAINQQINAIIPNSETAPAFLCQLVRALKPVIQHRATGVMTGIINKSSLAAIPAVRPPISLQNEFAERVTKIRALRAQQTASRRRLEDLFQSLLHGAFNGEL
jgi:type I restriction enzyme S subunit